MPNFLAASHYPGDLFGAAGLIPVGSRTSTGIRRQRKAADQENQPAKTYLLSADADSLARLEDIYRSGGDLDDSIREDALKFTGFALEGPDQVLKMGEGAVPAIVDSHFAFEAVLHPQLIENGEVDPLAGERVRADFVSYIEGLGGIVNIDFAHLEADMWYLPVLLPRDPAVLRRAAAFSQLRVLRPTPQFRDLRPSGEGLPDINVIVAKTPLTTRRIAIFDGGINVDALGLSGWVTEHDLTNRPRLQTHHEHGATVTSAALFGSLDDQGKAPHTAIDHYRIWPMPSGVESDIELPWVLDRIEEIVARGEHKIVVITLAPALNAEDSDPHLWTASLDRLALEHDVLFVVAAGNVGDLEPDLNRILVPADLINGLSVGSCSEKDGLAKRDGYSCVGPGRPGAMTAPTGVQFGGNLDATPFAALFPDGTVGACEGTSYAAPVVARACAELDVVPKHVVHPDLLGGWRCRSPSNKEEPDEAPR
ncbi:MAG TPA: S8 family serine peptidase [Solirubrobacterales bacterium]|nr:S8 family serine peptidase [Solirubrobacterales bacterium]